MLAEKIVTLVREHGIREGEADRLAADTMLEVLTAARTIWPETNATRKEVKQWAQEELELDD